MLGAFLLSRYQVVQCVCSVFIFKVTEPSPLQDSFGVRQKCVCVCVCVCVGD